MVKSFESLYFKYIVVQGRSLSPPVLQDSSTVESDKDCNEAETYLQDEGDLNVIISDDFEAHDDSEHNIECPSLTQTTLNLKGLQSSDEGIDDVERNPGAVTEDTVDILAQVLKLVQPGFSKQPFQMSSESLTSAPVSEPYLKETSLQGQEPESTFTTRLRRKVHPCTGKTFSTERILELHQVTGPTQQDASLTQSDSLSVERDGGEFSESSKHSESIESSESQAFDEDRRDDPKRFESISFCIEFRVSAIINQNILILG